MRPVDFNGVAVQVEGRSSSVAPLCEELGKLPPATGPVQILFRIEPQEAPTGPIQAEIEGHFLSLQYRVALAAQCILIELWTRLPRMRLYSALMSEHPATNSQLDVTICGEAWLFGPSLRRKLLAVPLRLASRDYMSLDQIIAKNILYDLIDPIVAIFSASRGAAHLHAASIVRGDSVLLLPGWGGAGKTSTILKLVRQYGFSFLADDYSLIRSNGRCVLNPKKLQIYAYNVQGDEALAAAVLKNSGSVDRLHWALRSRLLGMHQVRRRMTPVEIFGKDKIGSDGRVDTVIHLLRHRSADQLQLAPTTAVDLATRSTQIIQNELSSFFRFMLAVSAMDPSAPTVADVLRNIQETYESALTDADCFVLDIPAVTAPKELADTVAACHQHSILG